ncbi:MAG: hypothetical protein PVJ60_00845 [Phycisphaerales bacterium]|jgi:hypothetical protein
MRPKDYTAKIWNIVADKSIPPIEKENQLYKILQFYATEQARELAEAVMAARYQENRDAVEVVLADWEKMERLAKEIKGE